MPEPNTGRTAPTRGGIASVVLAAVAVLLSCGCVTPLSRGQRVAPYRPKVQPYRPGVASVPMAPVRPAVPVATNRPVSPVPRSGARKEPETRADVLKIGDQVSISLLGIEDAVTLKDVIDELGTVNLPYIGRMKLTGMATSEAEDAIKQKYITEQIYRKIDVNVVAQKEDYYVHGQVNKAGRFPWTSELTLMQAIAAAGGFNPFAKKSKIILSRGTLRYEFDAKRIAAGKDPDPPIKPGDSIEVLRGIWN